MPAPHHFGGNEMAYFVTGATGFIGRNLVERLLSRDGDIYVLVREGSTDRLEALVERWGRETGDSAAVRARIHLVPGDLRDPQLGGDDEQGAELRGSID